VSTRQKVAGLAVVVAVLVALAVKFSVDAARDQGGRVYRPPEWEKLSEEEREKKLDDEERTRRARGRGPSGRRLPEDPPAKATPR
jgi:hypothetical protein